MDQSPQQQPEVTELIRRIEASRQALGTHALDLRHKLDVPSRIKHSIISQPLAWFGSSLGAGFVASRLLRRPKKEAKARGLTGLVFASLFTLLKPALKGVITSELQRRFMDHAGTRNSHPETRLPLSKRPT